MKLASISETPIEATGKQPKEIPGTTTSVRKEPRDTQQRLKILDPEEELDPKSSQKQKQAATICLIKVHQHQQWEDNMQTHVTDIQCQIIGLLTNSRLRGG